MTINNHESSWDEDLEQAIFERHGIEKIGRGQYRVLSASGGSAHIVRYMGCTEDAFANLWECDCLAYCHRRHCRHIDVVAAANNEYCDERGYE